MRRLGYLVLCLAVVAICLPATVSAEEVAFEGIVTKVIEHRDYTALAIKHEEDGEVTYHQVVGDEIFVNRILSIAMMAEMNGIEVHVI